MALDAAQRLSWNFQPGGTKCCVATSLAGGFSSSTFSDSQTISAATEEAFTTTPTESNSLNFSGVKFSRKCHRSSTRQSHSADEAAFKSLQDVLQKAKQCAHVPPIGERLDACNEFFERAAKKRLTKADAELLKLHTEL